MQIDNPTSPLQVLYSILNPIEDDTDGSGESGDRDRGQQTGIWKEEQNRRERTTGRLMALVSNNPHWDPTWIIKGVELMIVIQYRQSSLTHPETPIPPLYPPSLAPPFIPFTTAQTPTPPQNPIYHVYQGEM